MLFTYEAVDTEMKYRRERMVREREVAELLAGMRRRRRAAKRRRRADRQAERQGAQSRGRGTDSSVLRRAA